MTARLNPNTSPPYRAWGMGTDVWGVQCAQGWNCLNMNGQGQVLTYSRERAEAVIRAAGHEPAEPLIAEKRK